MMQFRLWLFPLDLNNLNMCSEQNLLLRCVTISKIFLKVLHFLVAWRHDFGKLFPAENLADFLSTTCIMYCFELEGPDKLFYQSRIHRQRELQYWLSEDSLLLLL